MDRQVGSEPGIASEAYECDCCGRRNVPYKLKGIGYVCDDCLESYCWTGYESGPAPEPHYPMCPFKG